MAREWAVRIEDILGAVANIREYTKGMDLVGFRASPIVVDAVLRNLTVIGEAARHVPEELCARYPGVPWAQIQGMRNIVVHEYFGVDLGIIWETVQNDLAAVASRLREILKDADSSHS